MRVQTPARILIIGLLFLVSAAQEVAAQGTPVATPAGAVEEEISFESGPDTLYGTLRVPDGLDGPAPAALIISGSGPTDRNGDNAGLPLGTNRNIAADLAAIGVVSFRYDKLGSGETGLASHPDGAGVDYELFLQEAWDAFDVLAGRPEVDPERIVVIGHSEGALFALEMATDSEREIRPAGIVLAAPLSVRYLDLLRGQLGDAYVGVVEAGQVSQEQADALLDELDTAIAEIRETGALTTRLSDPGVAQLFSPANIAFLAQADQRDPAELARELPVDVPVLILHGAKDEHVSTDDVDILDGAFEEDSREGYARVEIADANHIFQVIAGEPNAQRDYLDPELPFSPEVGEALAAFFAHVG